MLNDLQFLNSTSGPHWPPFSNYLSGKANGVQPCSDFSAFEVSGENAESAAGTDKHRSTVRPGLLRQIHFNLRGTHITKSDHSAGKPWPMVDAWRVWFEGGRNLGV